MRSNMSFSDFSDANQVCSASVSAAVFEMSEKCAGSPILQKGGINYIVLSMSRNWNWG